MLSFLFINQRIKKNIFLLKKKMELLREKLIQPSTYEEMTHLIVIPEIIVHAQSLLPSTISSRFLLSAWLISRFPEDDATVGDMLLKTAADAVVACCTNNYNIIPVLQLFKSRLICWKEQDLIKFKAELMGLYVNLYNQQLETPSSASILEKTKSDLLATAFSIGGEEFVMEILADVNK
jgi:hypothetical protein